MGTLMMESNNALCVIPVVKLVKLAVIHAYHAIQIKIESNQDHNVFALIDFFKMAMPYAQLVIIHASPARMN